MVISYICARLLPFGITLKDTNNVGLYRFILNLDNLYYDIRVLHRSSPRMFIKLLQIKLGKQYQQQMMTM